MSLRHPLTKIAVLSFAALSMTSLAAPKETAKKIAVFSQKEAAFSETITLYADGKYKQTEKQTADKPYHVSSSRIPTAPTGSFPDPFSDFSRGGAWHLLDKEGGSEIIYKPGAKLPDTAVIALRGAMPFGFVWENHSPLFLHGDRSLPAKLFEFTPTPAQAADSSIIALSSPLPPLVKP